jgi:hypothetical protein
MSEITNNVDLDKVAESTESGKKEENNTGRIKIATIFPRNGFVLDSLSNVILGTSLAFF